MVLHLFTQNNTETAVVCFKINNLHSFKFFKMFIIIVYEFLLRELFLFSFSIFAPYKTDSTICLPIIKRITDTYIV